MAAVYYRRIGQERLRNSSRGTKEGIVYALLCSGRGLGMETPQVSTADGGTEQSSPGGTQHTKSVLSTAPTASAESYWTVNRIRDWARDSYDYSPLDRKVGSLDGISDEFRGVKRNFEDRLEINDTPEIQDSKLPDSEPPKRSRTDECQFEDSKIPDFKSRRRSRTDERPQVLLKRSTSETKPVAMEDSHVRANDTKWLTLLLRCAVLPEEVDYTEVRDTWAAMRPESRSESRPNVFWEAFLSVFRRRSVTMNELLTSWAAVSEKNIRTSDKAVKLPCAFRSEREDQLYLELDGSLLNSRDLEVLRKRTRPLVRVQETPQGTYRNARAGDLCAKVGFDLSRDIEAEAFDVFHTVIELEPVTVNESNVLSGSISFTKSGSTPLVANFTLSGVCRNLLKVLQERQDPLILFDSNNPRTWANLRTIHSSPYSRWTVDGQTVISVASVTGEIEPTPLSGDTDGSAEESEDPTESDSDTASSC